VVNINEIQNELKSTLDQPDLLNQRKEVYSKISTPFTKQSFIDKKKDKE
jgi:hypothetical protein